MDLLQLMLCVGAATLCWALPPRRTGGCGMPPRMDTAMLLGDFDAETYPEGQTVRYICRPGYSRYGFMKRICSEGEWLDISKPIGPCQRKRCTNPGEIDFGTFEIKNEKEFVFGAILEYSCDPGYEMISKYKTIECTATDWSKSPPHCAAKLCPPVTDESLQVASSVTDDEYTVGHTITLTCRDPRKKLHGLSQIYCTTNGTWSEELPTCKASCSVQTDRLKQHNVRVKNGQAWNVPHGQVIQLECIPGYGISAPADLSITCQDGRITYPTCHVADNLHIFKTKTSEVQMKVKVTSEEKQVKGKRTCPPPPSISFGEPFGEMKDVYDTGSSVTYKCMSYHKLKGKETIHCRNGVWKPQPPTCLVPCVVNHDYATGNHTMTKKKYPKHNEVIKFQCLPNFKSSNPELLNVKCINGTMTYPKCFRMDKPTVPPSVETGIYQATGTQIGPYRVEEPEN